MIKNKTTFIFSVVFFVFLSSLANAKINKVTSYENRPICEKSNGTWREFGDRCVDSCESKFDKYPNCIREQLFACDCGDGNCWQGEKCVKISQYKKNYAQIQKEKDEELEAKKKEREEKIKSDPALAYYMRNLYQKQQEEAAKQNIQNSKNKPKQAPKQGAVQVGAAQQQIPTQPRQQQRIPPAFVQQQNQESGLDFPIIPLPEQ